MIFYFSGTGNSEFAAKKLAGENERLIDMAAATKNQEFDYELEEGEKLGFVFPVYFYTVPTFVAEFIDKLNVTNVSYSYAVITCGGSISKAGVVLKRLLGDKSIKLSYVKELLMPDNSMLFYQIPKASEGKVRVEAATLKLEAVKKEVELGKTTELGASAGTSTLLGKAYKLCQGTKKFWADAEKCIGCGLCENNCPEAVIKLVDKKPVWNKEKCCKCSACINRCPKQAIQYGKKTANRNRYAFENINK